MGDDNDDEICNTKLGLGIGLDDFKTKRDDQKSKCKPITCLDLSLIPLHPKDERRRLILYDNIINDKKTDEDSGSIGSKTKEKDESCRQSHNNFGFIRKKLRLTTEQSTILEDSFRHQTTLTTAQKQALAQKLNLKPRQVEVWFQNRRARTKLKQTEVDCEYLRKRCENLSDENRRLKKELQELRLLKKDNISNPPLYVQLQKAANYNKTIANICQYCENFGRSSVKINAGGVKIEPLGATEKTRVLDVVHDQSNIINGKQKQQIGHGFNLIIPEVERER